MQRQSDWEVLQEALEGSRKEANVVQAQAEDSRNESLVSRLKLDAISGKDMSLDFTEPRPGHCGSTDPAPNPDAVGGGDAE